ncbi:PKD domain-containing protein [Anaerobaca lacustris]|uniref:PKD domain-containing protein n=1 Tax=Anaerobaca lacustris TaxID=3044600 RepID=A0AAW6U165_9BACT|nr:PKD domain-containing protein [Sedimentisphaerales bacterium M17dextr]
MPNQNQFIRQTSAVLIAFGLILGLLPGFAAAQDGATRGAHAQEASHIHHREHNLLLDATRSGNMHTFGVGLRGDGTPAQREAHSHNYIVYDFKRQVFLDFRGTTSQVGKTLASKTDYYEYGVSKGANLGVVLESQAAYWMAEWPAPVSANFIRLMGSMPNEPSQANTAWKIEFRSNGQWRVHAQGVGGWYDRGEYFWGGRDQSPIQFDALRVKLYSKDGSTSVSSLHFRAQENGTWMIAHLPPIDALITVTQQVPRAGEVANFAGNQVFGTVQSWQWDFGDGSSATGQTVSHAFANPRTYDVTLTVSGAGQTADIAERVTIYPAIEAQITPLSGSVLEGDEVTFDASNSYGAIGAYHWDFGDGTTATGQQVAKSFAEAGIYRVTLTVSNGTASNSCSALVRVNTPATVNVLKVLLDTDVEIDDLYYVAYALYTELDIVGINTIHHGGENPAQEPGNHARLLTLLDLASQSGLPAVRVPRAFSGAAGPLIPPYSDNWRDTKPVVTEASEAILEAARGASADSPVWVVPVGPLTNVAVALLQVRREGWESEFHQRIRICWLGGSPSGTRIGTWNGKRDPWAAYIVAQSGIEFLLMLEPTGIQLRWDKRDERSRYPDTPLGNYLYNIGWNRHGGYYDPTALAAIISIHADEDWFGDLQTVTLRDRYQNYGWASAEASNIRLIRSIDASAIKEDWFETINGRPTKLRKSVSGTYRSRRGTDGGK